MPWLLQVPSQTVVTMLTVSGTASLGPVVRMPASMSEDPGFESHFRPDFSGSSHTNDLKIGTPVATMPGAWRYRVSTGTGRIDVLGMA